MSPETMKRTAAIAKGPAKVSFGDAPLGGALLGPYELQFLTPVFGGGAVAKQAGDEVTPVRGSSLRGQLRFWWRATRGGRYGSIEELREDEERLWGQASAPGLVDIEIEQNLNSTERHVYELNQRNGRIRPIRDYEDLAYLAFPLQPTSDEARAGVKPRPLVDYSGRIIISLRLRKGWQERDRKDVDAAFWALRHFGGLGGRTRRGFGALSLTEKESAGDAATWLSSEHIINKKPPKGVSSLAPVAGAELQVRKQETKGVDAWKLLAKKMRVFRQGEMTGRNKGSDPGNSRKLGRSFWPEPDVIRHKTGRGGRYIGAPTHQDPMTGVNKVPRAQFGLPIIFQFPQERMISERTLQPAKDKVERLASPLIIRPVGSTAKARPMVLLLGNRVDVDIDRELGGLQFKSSDPDTPVQAQLTEKEAAKIKPLNRGESPITDPLRAFMRYVEED